MPAETRTVDQRTDRAARFGAQRYLALPGFLEDPLLFTLYRYALRLATTGQLHPDPRIPGALCRYGDCLMDTLLEFGTSTVASITGLDVVPTYSYLRIYTQGDALALHTDRASCEFTISICLGVERGDANPDYEWPLFVRVDKDRPPLRVAGPPGDAFLFCGQDFAHWREPFEGEHQAQLFLHYVDQNGPHAAHENDGRQSLGLPRAPHPRTE